MAAYNENDILASFMGTCMNPGPLPLLEPLEPDKGFTLDFDFEMSEKVSYS